MSLPMPRFLEWGIFTFYISVGKNGWSFIFLLFFIYVSMAVGKNGWVKIQFHLEMNGLMITDLCVCVCVLMVVGKNVWVHLSLHN